MLHFVSIALGAMALLLSMAAGSALQGDDRRSSGILLYISGALFASSQIVGFYA